MRWLRLCTLISVLLLFSGCSGQRLDHLVQELSHQYGSTDQFETRALVTAHYEDYDAVFKLRYLKTGAEKRVEVEEPESLSGISAVVGENCLSLGYEDVILAAGDFDQLQFSPLSMLPLMMQQLQERFPDSYQLQNERISLCYSMLLDARPAEFEIECDLESYFPLRGAVYLDGYQILSAEVLSFASQ